jgi:hopene-associated glycosyltransferase HpnB
VCVVVPARNESGYVPRTLPALLAQDYPGEWRVVLVDDRSEDGTAAIARGLAEGDERLTVVSGAELPAGWAGKLWALTQGALEAGEADYLLLTDADIRHAPGSVRRLVAESEAAALALNSRMARLRCLSAGERLLIPPFLFFFNLLYPMRRVNDETRPHAAAAGGCILVRRDALERAGGFESIRAAIIDDVNLARCIKALDERIRLALSRADVESTREHGLGSIWRMVRRTAFDELAYSWSRLIATVLGLALLFALPPQLVAVGLALWSWPWSLVLAGVGLLAWASMTAAFLPAVRFFSLNGAWAWTLPLAGILYGGMTLDSARRHLLGRRGAW